MLETSARLLRVLSLLQSRRDWTGPRLAERLGVTTRTVRHDIDRLRQLGYTVDSSLGLAGGYRLGTGANIPPLLLDDDEAIAVTVGLRMATSGAMEGIEDASVRALGKVQQLLPSALRRRVAALQSFSVSAAGAPSSPSVDAQVLTALASACRDQQRTRIDYRRNDGFESRRDIEPHRLVYARRRWYLVAWDVQRGAWRTFRVDRVRLPTNRPGPHFSGRVLPDDDPASYVLTGIERARWPYRVTVVAYGSAETIIGRLPAHTLVEPIDQASCRVELGADSPRAIAPWLGTLDVDFDIEQPQAHPELIQHLKRVASRYERAAH